MSWNTALLKDLCTKIGSGSTPKGGDSVYIAKGVSLIRSQNVYNLRFDYEGLAHIDEAAAKKLNNVIIEENDVLINITGDSVARTCVVPKDVLPARVNQHVAILRPNSVILNSRFLNYYLATSYMQAFMLNLAVGKGASRNAMTKSMLEGFSIPLPAIETQNLIANILSRYDDLIENYQKQIKLLEEAAQRIYKEWFVDFHFPGHENVKIVNGVPEGWEKKNVGELVDRIPTTKQIQSSEILKKGETPVVDQSRNFIAGYTNDTESLVKHVHPMIVFGDHTRILKYIQFPFAKGADGTQLILSNDLDRMPQSLFYLSLVNIDLSNYSYARHFKYLKAEHILVPNKMVAKDFDNIVSMYFCKIQNCRNIITQASEARDRLLPKLMSGEIEV